MRNFRESSEISGNLDFEGI
jgi:hypothetical protein